MSDSRPLVIIKLGGSAITIKDSYFALRKEVISGISDEIRDFFPERRMIIVHGGGSFGHPVAALYSLQNGKASNAPSMALSDVEDAMMRLNRSIIEALRAVKLPAFPVQTAAVSRAKEGRLEAVNSAFFSELLSWGLLPVCYGSLVFDNTMGYSIVSGDNISVALALKLKASSIIFVSDVDGIYDSDPKVHPGAKLIRVYHALGSSLKEDRVPSGKDVTGGIANKIRSVVPALSAGIEVRIVNGLKRGQLSSALKGEDVGTKVVI
ncbi:MAG: isopentenyl phosphate kinase [Thermoprotei archaeon]|nr:isopentenyl phosphate kinase [TACK group archaeon]